MDMLTSDFVILLFQTLTATRSNLKIANLGGGMNISACFVEKISTDLQILQHMSAAILVLGHMDVISAGGCSLSLVVYTDIFGLFMERKHKALIKIRPPPQKKYVCFSLQEILK